MKVRKARFRAIITLDPAEPRPATLHPPGRRYLNPTRALVVRARPLRNAGPIRYLPAEICWDSEQPLHPGDHATVTITVTDDEASTIALVGSCRFLQPADAHQIRQARAKEAT